MYRRDLAIATVSGEAADQEVLQSQCDTRLVGKSIEVASR
jgi:hypothetical protein